MTYTMRTLAVFAVLTAAACSDPARFDDTNAVDLNAPAPGAIDNGLGADPASDPTSPAFFSQRVGDRVLFVVDSSDLTVEAKSILSAQASWLMSNTDYRAVIEGHADEQGTTEYNLALGARRANAAKEYLIAQGVPEGRLRTVTFGKERPAELCAAEACYAKNRRAVTIISTGGLG